MYIATFDIFYVNEDKRFEGAKYSIGGITKASDKVVDQVAEARVIKEDHTGEYDYDFFPFKIDKEAMTLKEVDFKIRKHLIDHYGLYGEMSSGTVTVQMKYYMASIQLNWIKVTRRPNGRYRQSHRY